MPERIVNFDDPKQAARVLNGMRSLSGRWRLDFRRYRPRRSDRQNRYYWPCFVQPFGRFLRDQGEVVTDQDAHEILKHKFLRVSITDRSTNEQMAYSRSTRDLDTSEFNTYLDRCAQWLGDMFGIVIPDPTGYHEPQDAVQL